MESVLENETHKILWVFELQTDNLIPARRPDLVLIDKKKTCHLMDFAVPTDHSKNERKRKDRQILGPCQRTEKTVEHEGEGRADCDWDLWNNPQRVGKESG